jgi:hypothetical protein
LRHQPQLFGQVASTATAWRQIDALGEAELEHRREARRLARARAWQVAVSCATLRGSGSIDLAASGVSAVKEGS